MQPLRRNALESCLVVVDQEKLTTSSSKNLNVLKKRFKKTKSNYNIYNYSNVKNKFQVEFHHFLDKFIVPKQKKFFLENISVLTEAVQGSSGGFQSAGQGASDHLFFLLQLKIHGIGNFDGPVFFLIIFFLNNFGKNIEYRLYFFLSLPKLGMPWACHGVRRESKSIFRFTATASRVRNLWQNIPNLTFDHFI